jgi:hypothetical protein
MDKKILKYGVEVKDDGRLDLTDVLSSEVATIRKIADKIFKHEGITTNLKIKGTDGNKYTTLSIGGIEDEFISMTDWCLAFHKKENGEDVCNAIVESLFKGEIQVLVKKQSVYSTPTPHVNQRVPVHSKTSNRISLHDMEEEEEQFEKKIDNNKLKKRIYIPPALRK